MPNKAGADTDIAVRAYDSANQVSEASLELEIIDDTEPPTLQLSKPEGDFSLPPGTNFQIQGSAGDNQYVDSLDPLLIDPDTREEHAVAWELFSRKDRVETVKVPNPPSAPSSSASASTPTSTAACA